MASLAKPSAKEVGDAFAELYYHVLQKSSEHLHKFYEDHSKILRPRLDGTMRASTLPDIIEDLNMLSFGGFDSVEITSVMSQYSNSEDILVVVEGYFTLNERHARNFTQRFFLGPHKTGYFVLTDMFKFVDILPEVNETIPPAANNGGQVIEENVPETEEAADESLRVSEPNLGFENASKLSYASVVTKGITIGQGQHSSSPMIKADAVEDSRNRNSQKSQAVSEGACIYVTLLPRNATIALVENAFKQFGKIRRGGIDVRSKRNCKYAFVEFEEADAAKRVIMAAPIMFDGRKIYVEMKRPYYKSQHSSSCDHSAEIKADAAVTEGAGIYVKNLPRNATIALVENVFKAFGSIKKRGIRVRSSASSYWYAFVEFEEADAAKRAINASPLSIYGYTTEVEKQRPDYKSNCESPSARPGNIHRGEEVMRGSLGNPYWNWQEMMEEVRGTDVWQKLKMGARGTEVYDLRNWQKIMDTQVYDCEKSQELVEEQMKFQEEQMKIEENENWENLTEEQRKIQEEEGRQYNQNRYRSELMKESGGVGQIPEEEEEENQN